MNRAGAIVRDFLERGLTSAAEQFLAVVLATGTVLSLTGLPWAAALATAGGAFVVSVLATGIQYLAKVGTLPFWPDLLVRVAKSFLASLAATLGAGVVNIVTVPWLVALNTAALVAFLTLVKGFVAAGDTGTASLLPSHVIAATKKAA